MTLQSTIDFKYVQQDIQNIFSEDNSSLLPFLLRLDSYLCGLENEEFLNSKLKKLSDDLIQRSEGLASEDKFFILNDLFFNHQGYIANVSDDPPVEDLSFSFFLTKKKGNSLLVALLYQYLAIQIDLPIYIINTPPFHIAKWYRADKIAYVDLSQHGKVYNQQEVLDLLNKKTFSQDSFEIVTLKQIFIFYLNTLISAFSKSHDTKKILTCLNLLIETEENNLNAIKTRAIVQYNRGELDHSLIDIKRYLAFVDFNCAPDEIKTIYQKISNLKTIESQIDEPPLFH